MLSITLNKKVKGVLEDVITPLGTYLKTNLQAISQNWWEDIVLNCLTEGQLKNIQGRKITTIYELDLAALIRIFDSNWNLISQRQEILPEFRNILREMRSVRNRWSHAGASSYPKEDIFRDLDTLNRFAKEIDADTSLLNNIKELMSELLTEFSDPIKRKSVALNPKIKILLPKYKKDDLDSIAFDADILSVAAGKTKSLVDQYHIHSCPNYYSYNSTKYITFRAGGTGEMDALYEIDKILIIPADARDNLNSLSNQGLNEDEIQRLISYMRKNPFPQNDRYYILSRFKELTHRPKSDGVDSKTHYYSLSRLLESKAKAVANDSQSGKGLDRKFPERHNDEPDGDKSSWNNFSGKNLSRQNLAGNNYKNAELEHTNFSESNLQEVDFRFAYIRHTSFNKADLRNSNFQNATLLDVNIEEANLCGADLRFRLIRLSDGKLQNGHISCKQILSSFIDQKTKLPEYMKIHWVDDATYSLEDVDTAKVVSNATSGNLIIEEPKRTEFPPTERNFKRVNDDGGLFGWLIGLGVICVLLWFIYG